MNATTNLEQMARAAEADEIAELETEFLDRFAGLTPAEYLKDLLKLKAVIDGLVDEARRDAEAVPA